MRAGPGSGKPRILRVALIWVVRNRLAYAAKLGASEPSYDRSATLAVIAITVLGDGIRRAKEWLTDVTGPLHSLPDQSTRVLTRFYSAFKYSMICMRSSCVSLRPITPLPLGPSLNS
jgi:hypothetical protein